MKSAEVRTEPGGSPMDEDGEPRSLEQLLDRIDEAAEDDEHVSLCAVLEVVGRRSFGASLLVAGLAVLAPIVGDIPGMPTIIGVIVVLIASQLLFGRKHIWLPTWLLERSVPRDRLRRALGWMRRPARFIDRLLRPRLRFLTRGAATRVVAVVCMVVALAMPIMEFVPFSANLAGGALTAFGLSLVSRDGLLALVSFTLTGLIIGVVVYVVL